MSTTLQSVDLPTASPSVPAELEAILHAAAIAPLADTAWIRVTGSDRVRWLNGMVTNGIQQLAPGEGCYNFVLNAQGRIQGDLTAFMQEDSILLETSHEQVPVLLAHFERFIIMDDVELADVSNHQGILITGPDALRTVQGLGGAPCTAPSPTPQTAPKLCLKQTVYRNAPVTLIQSYSPLVPRFEIWADPETIAEMVAELGSIPKVAPQTLEALRILEGTPRYGPDIRNSEAAKDLPQETGQTRALHFAKGCYLGQEIVERIHSRGNVHRTFSGFKLTGTHPTPGTALLAEGKPVGVLTSVAHIPVAAGSVQLALGYVRRDALDRRLILEYAGGTATAILLPYESIS